MEYITISLSLALMELPCCTSVCESFQSLQEKIVSLSDANATLDAAAHEAKAAQNRIQQEKV